VQDFPKAPKSKNEKAQTMDASELQDFKENLEQGANEEPMRPVAFTMSVLAVLLAVTTVMGGRTHEDAVLNQNRATDQWNEFQARDIRNYNTQLATDLLSVVALDNKAATAKLIKGYADHEKKWADELKQDQAVALALQTSVDKGEAKADRFDLGEVLLEVGLVIVSITLLTRSRVYWHLGLVVSALGVAASASAFFLK
jgi:type II secretory pathway component PulM